MVSFSFGGDVRSGTPQSTLLRTNVRLVSSVEILVDSFAFASHQNSRQDFCFRLSVGSLRHDSSYFALPNHGDMQ